MENTIASVFTVLSVVIAAVDFTYGCKAFRKSEEFGRYLGLASAAAGVVTIAYLISMWTHRYIVFSVASSVYFACIDWMLVALAHFVYCFTGMHMFRSSGVIRQCIRAYALFDSGVMLVNIFHEIAVHYVARDTSVAPYVYEMKPLYYMHLAFTYLLVALVLFILFYKTVRTPRQYRNQYTFNILAIVFVVLVNAVFLYPEGGSILTQLDYSIIGYSLGVYLMYWAAFDYRKKNMLESLSMTIFENIDQGIVLFDYNEKLIMSNQRAERLLPDVSFSEKMDCEQFLELCALPKEIRKEEQLSIQCEARGRQSGTMRCDYRRLRDHRGGVTGSLFVFTDTSFSTDPLTGFQHWEDFRRFAAENPYNFDHPTTAVVFDIVGLGEVNRTFGREVGDQRIRRLARTMRTYMPEGTYYVRGYEAHLVAVCFHNTEADIRGNVDRVVEAGAGTVLFGMSSTVDGTGLAAGGFDDRENRNIIRTVEAASRTLQVKKLLSSKSVHSQTLTSLVRALQESDSDTEAHVRRTQKMGVALGLRIGLSDEQIADLRLLCLLHDIGKIGIPLEILNKPGKLTEEEFAVLRTHVEKGYQIAMSSDELKSIARMILCHHERWDGKGYPEGLSGNSIPVLSRFIAIVDAYDAMVNNRSYRKGMDPELAQEELRRGAGMQFDPYLTEEFLAMLEENPDIALGEKTGGEEVRVFHQKPVETEGSGNTFLIQYSRYLLDLDENIIEVDDRFQDITGYSRSDAVGHMTQFDLVPAEDRAYYMLQVNNQFARGDIAYLRHEIIRKDGDRVWVVCYGKRYYDSAAKAFRSEILIFRSGDPV